jgi:hypothetical protein
MTSETFRQLARMQTLHGTTIIQSSPHSVRCFDLSKQGWDFLFSFPHAQLSLATHRHAPLHNYASNYTSKHFGFFTRRDVQIVNRVVACVWEQEPNMAAKWFAAPVGSQEVPGSDLRQQTVYLYRNFSSFSSAPRGKRVLNNAMSFSFHIFLNSLFKSRPIIQCCRDKRRSWNRH